jgi:hypothetical protein
LAPTLTVCHLVIMIRGQLASFGAAVVAKGRPPNYGRRNTEGVRNSQIGGHGQRRATVSVQ